MAKSNWDRHIPLRNKDGHKPHRDDWRQDLKGDMIRDGYQCSGKQGDPEGRFDWVSADTEFYACFRLIGYGKGRSAVWFELENTNGVLFYLSLQHIVELFARTEGPKGFACGWWSYEKQGSPTRSRGLHMVSSPSTIQ